MALALLLLAIAFLAMNVVPLVGWRGRWDRQRFLRAKTDWRLAKVEFSVESPDGNCTAVCSDPATLAYLDRAFSQTSRGYLFPGGALTRATFWFRSGARFSVSWCLLGAKGMEIDTDRLTGPARYRVPFTRPLPNELAAMIKFVGDKASRGKAYFGLHRPMAHNAQGVADR